MADMPVSREDFIRKVAEIARRQNPDLVIEIIDNGGKVELLLNQHHIDVENFMRVGRANRDRWADIMEEAAEKICMLAGADANRKFLSFQEAKARIMPRIQPLSIFETLNQELVPHIPLANDTIITFVYDLPHAVESITKEQMTAWGKTEEDLLALALDNLEVYADYIDLDPIVSCEGKKAVIVAKQDCYDSARLLLSSVQERLRALLGGDYEAVIPARDMFIAMQRGDKGFLSRIYERAAEDGARLPYPITDKPFLVTRDGIVGLGETEPRLTPEPS